MAEPRFLAALLGSFALHAAILFGWRDGNFTVLRSATPALEVRFAQDEVVPATPTPPAPPARPQAPKPVTATKPLTVPSTSAPPQPMAPEPAAVPAATSEANTASPTSRAADAGTAPTAALAPPSPKRTAAVVDADACAKPRYPRASLRDEESGTVTLAFLIGTDGLVQDSRVERSSGHPRLDEAARQALALCRFRPATADGRPEASWARLKYVWRIE